MPPPVDLRDPGGRTLSRGPAFLYIAPLAYEDLLKLGFSRDPLERLRNLHPRFFEVFDLDRTLLVATETVRDARALELHLRRTLVEHNAPAPLTMQAEAGGASEWYRGAYAVLEDEVVRLGALGHQVHAPARPWFAAALTSRAALVHDWAAAMLSADELDGLAGPTRAQQVVRDTLDAYMACGIDVAPLLPRRVLDWYGRGGR